MVVGNAVEDVDVVIVVDAGHALVECFLGVFVGYHDGEKGVLCNACCQGGEE